MRPPKVEIRNIISKIWCSYIQAAQTLRTRLPLNVSRYTEDLHLLYVEHLDSLFLCTRPYFLRDVYFITLALAVVPSLCSVCRRSHSELFPSTIAINSSAIFVANIP